MVTGHLQFHIYVLDIYINEQSAVNVHMRRARLKTYAAGWRYVSVRYCLPYIIARLLSATVIAHNNKVRQHILQII